MWLIVDRASFHISPLRIRKLICKLALDLPYSLELIVHVPLYATRSIMLAVRIDSNDFIFVKILYGRVSVDLFLWILRCLGSHCIIPIPDNWL